MVVSTISMRKAVLGRAADSLTCSSVGHFSTRPTHRATPKCCAGYAWRRKLPGPSPMWITIAAALSVAAEGHWSACRVRGCIFACPHPDFSSTRRAFMPRPRSSRIPHRASRYGSGPASGDRSLACRRRIWSLHFSARATRLRRLTCRHSRDEPNAVRAGARPGWNAAHDNGDSVLAVRLDSTPSDPHGPRSATRRPASIRTRARARPGHFPRGLMI